MSDQEEQLDDRDEEEAEEENDEDEENEGEEEAKEEEEPEEEFEDMPLNQEIVAECISLLCKIGTGLSHAYVKLDCQNRELTSIDFLNKFIYLRYINLTSNHIKDLSPLNNLKELLTLRCEKNALSVVDLKPMPYLQHLNLNGNKIQTLSGTNHPLLEHLSLNFNKIKFIEGLDSSILQRLHTLELRGNSLTSTEGLHLPNLKNLFLAQNKIREIRGLDRLEQLTSLHLRDNQLETLDGFTENMKHLQYLNLRGNAIAQMKEVNKLKSLPLLRAIVLAENPIADEDEYRLEVLISLRKIVRLDKDDYMDEEREEAETIYEQRMQDELNNPYTDGQEDATGGAEEEVEA